MKVLFVTDNPGSSIAKALAPGFGEFSVSIIHPNDIVATLDKDVAALTTSDYHIVTDHLASVSMLRRELTKRRPNTGTLHQALIALIETDADMAITRTANVMLSKSQGHIPLRDKINAIRPKVPEKTRRASFVR